MQLTNRLAGLLLYTMFGASLALLNVVQMGIDPEISYSRNVQCVNPNTPGMKPFSAVIKCSQSYQRGAKISCQIDITNHLCVDYHVLKWYTPLEGMRSQFLLVTKNGKPIPYDGMLTKRGSPSSRDYLLIRAGTTVSSKVDISLAYPIKQSGQHEVQVQMTVQYRIQPNANIDNKQTLKSTVAVFKLVGNGIPTKTMGEYVRQNARYNSGQLGAPLDPLFVGGTAAQQSLTKEIHRASYHYISVAEDDIDDNQAHYIAWFGAVDAGRMNQVKQKWRDMKQTLETDIYTYHFDDPGCLDNWFAYTFFDATDIYLCNHYDPANDVLGIDTKLCTIVHELSHAKTHTQDHEYGRQDCLDLANRNPILAIDNGDNYGYFAETTNIFDNGFDSIARLPNKRTYVTRGNVYIRYSDDTGSTIDAGYPVLIKGQWGNLPDSFNAGFDSMAKLRNGKTYITKGNQYVRYSDSSGGTVDPGYPASLQHSWGNLPAAFIAGFDSMTVLPNDKTYVTKGNQYVRYSDSAATTIDPGYPATLHWGNLPPSFAESFDAMAVLGNGKTYVFKDKQYIRYSDSSASKIDPTYPVSIRGRWGTINFPGPH